MFLLILFNGDRVAILAHAWIKSCVLRWHQRQVAILAHAWIKIGLWGRDCKTLLQSSRMHESKSSSLVSLSCRMNCNPRTCMNQNSIPFRIAYSSSCCNPRVCMNQNKTYAPQGIRASCNPRAYMNQKSPLKVGHPTYRCNPRACMNWNTLRPIPNVSNIRLQSSHMHESKSDVDGERSEMKALQSSRMHESKSLI